MSKKILLNCFIVFVSVMTASISHADKKVYHSPEQVEGTTKVTVQQAKELFDKGVVFIDVRNPRYYAKGHIPGAFHFDLKHNFDEAKLDGVVKKDQSIVIYCSGVKCSRSYRAATKAVSWGFTKVQYFRGGIAEWKKAGYSVVTGKQEAEE